MFDSRKSAASHTGRPPSALELSPEGALAAARVSPSNRNDADSPIIYSFASLPAGALVPSLEGANLRLPDAVSDAIRIALGEVSPRSRSVTLVLPDTLVRVFVLDFDSLPAKPAEAASVVRFRLRKMVPFDVEHAGLSYQVLSKTESECKILAAVVPGPILEEYEAAVRDAGYEPGAVLPSSIAALEALEQMESVMAANLSSQSITTSIANGEDLLLYRTIDLPQEPVQRLSEIQRSIAVAAAYFEDKLGARPRRLHYAGTQRRSEFAQFIAIPDLVVVEWVDRPTIGSSIPQTSLAGVAGALVGAR